MPARTTRPDTRIRRPKSPQQWEDWAEEMSRGHLQAVALQDEAGRQLPVRVNRADGAFEYRWGGEWHPLPHGDNLTRITNYVVSAGGGGGGGTPTLPAGPDGAVQYNAAGAFGGNANFYWDITNGILQVKRVDAAQLYLLRGSGQGASLLAYGATGDLYLCGNCYYTGTSWQRFATGLAGVLFITAGQLRFSNVATGSGGISSFTERFNISALGLITSTKGVTHQVGNLLITPGAGVVTLSYVA